MYHTFTRNRTVTERAVFVTPGREDTIFQAGSVTPVREDTIFQAGSVTPGREDTIFQAGSVTPDREDTIFQSPLVYTLSAVRFLLALFLSFG